MALTQRLDLKQTTSLTMTPQLQMAIQLLQMSNMELSSLIQTELEQNPFLELSESSTTSDAPSDEREEMDFDAKASEDMDVDYDNTWQESGSGGSEGGDPLDMMGTLHKEQTLYEYVKEQFLIDVACPRKRLIGSYLIDHLTPAGYLEEPLADIAKGLGAPLKEVEEVLGLIQACDPPGIGARNLKECLSLQLKEIGELTEDVQTILTHLDELMKGDLKGFSKTCGVQLEIIQEILVLIRTLNPRPGAGFDAPLAQTRIPDVIVTPNTTKTGWFVRMNTETIPKVLLNRTYHAHVKKGASGADDKTFVTEKFMAASWLIKAIDQRMQTILKVSSEIVRQQEAFLNEGIHHLKPLILKDIALAIGMHESTISRVTTNKFMATPRGVFELKYFFTTSLQSNEGEDAHSSELVRHRIKALVEGEGIKPLSDDKLVQLLSSEGIQVARRTITKYREALNIPSSFERKKRKALL